MLLYGMRQRGCVTLLPLSTEACAERVVMLQRVLDALHDFSSGLVDWDASSHNAFNASRPANPIYPVLGNQ